MTYDQTAAVPTSDEGASATGQHGLHIPLATACWDPKQESTVPPAGRARPGDDRDDTTGQIMLLPPADPVPPAMQSVRRSTSNGRTDVIKVMGNTKWA